MANTSPDGIYYPDSNTLMNFDAILATMASSIQNGIGKRLAHQEIAVGMKASVAAGAWNVPVNAAVIPYAISPSPEGDFNQGFTFNNSVATVKTAGMYLISASVGVTGAVNGWGTRLVVQKNGVRISSLETPQVTPIWGGICITAVTNCVPGDTFRALANISGTNPAPMSVNPEGTNLSIVLVQALPL